MHGCAVCTMHGEEDGRWQMAPNAMHMVVTSVIALDYWIELNAIIALVLFFLFCEFTFTAI